MIEETATKDIEQKNRQKHKKYFRGFKNGIIYWDDEDRKNSKEKGGVLPSGIYDRDTLINYCCRSDGSDRTKIVLPTYRTFYLLRYFTSTLCQLVKGMDVRIEFVKTNDEDHYNKNYNSGSHPANGGNSNIKLYYCYYE
ncbi:uncharacterized protein LOC134723014 [Mytilus trossulus]|uniref:uncharacterized protein LOC134723014 n=1 Tax=Mytilus trossulus TaxID=6551 RepID=UPI003007D2FD